MPSVVTPRAAAIQIKPIDGILVGVIVVVGTTARYGVDLEEASERRLVEPDAHEDDTAEVVGCSLFAAEPVVSAGADLGVAEFVGRLVGGCRRAGRVGAGDVAVQVGELVGECAGLVEGDGEVAVEPGRVDRPAAVVAGLGDPVPPLV
jgi:hypothetical protein